jgi:hypothetical protein
MRVKSPILMFAGEGQTLFVCQLSGEDGEPKLEPMLPPVAGFGYPNASTGLRLCARQSDLHPGRREPWENAGLVRHSEQC